MASSDKVPVACPASSGDGKEPMGNPTKTTTAMLEKGTAMMQSMKPIRQMSLHVCSFACYSHDPGRQIEVHIYGHRVNQDFLQCAVYDSNSSKAHLIGKYTSTSIVCLHFFELSFISYQLKNNAIYGLITSLIYYSMSLMLVGSYEVALCLFIRFTHSQFYMKIK